MVINRKPFKYSSATLVVALVSLAATIPIKSLTNFYFIAGYFNLVYVLLYFSVAILLVARFQGSFNHIKLAPYVYLFIFLSYYLVSVVALNRSATIAFRQAEFFLPFVLSIFLLHSGMRPDERITHILLYSAISISAFLATTLHIFAGDVMRSRLSEYNEEAALITELGRLYWDSGSLSIIALYLHVTSPHIKNNKYSIFFLAGILSALLYTQSRTLILSSTILLIYYSGVSIKSSVKISVILFIILFSFSMMSDSMQELFYKRFLIEDASEELNIAFELNRLVLYEGYINLFLHSPLIGNGFGVEYFYNSFNDTPVYITDVSILAFVLPFGFFGAILFYFFIARLLRVAKFNLATSSDAYKNYIFLVIVSLFVSFNIDLFSRDIYVVALTLIAICASSKNAKTK